MNRNINKRQFGVIGTKRLSKAARYYSASELQYIHSENYQNMPEFGDYGKARPTDNLLIARDSQRSKDRRLDATILYGEYNKTKEGGYHGINASKEKPMKNRGSFDPEDQLWGYN